MDDPNLTMTYLTSRSNLPFNASLMGIIRKVDFSITVEAKSLYTLDMVDLSV